MREPPNDDNNNLELGRSALGRRRRPRPEADQAVLAALATALRDDDKTSSRQTSRREPTIDKSHPQVWRAGLMAAALALIAGGLGWVGGLLAVNSQQDALAVAAARPAWVDPLETSGSAMIEQEARLASVTIDLRETQDSVLRVWNEARSAAAKIEALASNMESIKSDLDGTRTDIARVEDMLRDEDATAVAAAEPEQLGFPDPAEQQAMLARIAQATPQNPQNAAVAQVAETAAATQPATTGALPEAVPAEKPVMAALQKIKRQKRVSGWAVHSVRDDLALVEGHGQHYEVRVGEMLPEAGLVRAIKKYGEQWVVLTNRGYIAEPR
ncbi:MAG TPA: hypothetical protein VHN20_10255 [Beijerinckiaceae bacterium]|nr:hypothetical protein [Beijerinckiaceae bacterium]